MNDLTVEKELPLSRLKTRLTSMALFSVAILLLVITVLTIPELVSMFEVVSEGGDYQPNILVSLLITVVAEVITIFIALKVVWGLRDWKNLLMLKNFQWKNVLYGLSIGLILFLLLQLMSFALDHFGVRLESSDTSLSFMGLVGWEKALVLGFLAPFIVPLVEELFFRGYILNFLRNGLGSASFRLYGAVLISTFYFAILHFQGTSLNDWITFLWIFMVGLINSYLVIKYDSLYPAIAVHIGYNGVTSLLLLVAVV